MSDSLRRVQAITAAVDAGMTELIRLAPREADRNDFWRDALQSIQAAWLSLEVLSEEIAVADAKATARRDAGEQVVTSRGLPVHARSTS